MSHDPNAAPDPVRAPRRVRRLSSSMLRRFRRDRDGATAVEFAFVAAPFFALMFAIIETGLVFWTSQVLETAVADASRRIYTGQFQTAQGATASPAALQAAFRAEVCGRVVALFDCERSLHVDVRSFPNFGAVTLPSILNTAGNVDPGAFSFQQSAASAVVVVRAAIEYPVFVTLLDASRSNLANGKRLIMATATFRNEPFGS